MLSAQKMPNNAPKTVRYIHSFPDVLLLRHSEDVGLLADPQ